VPDEWPRFRLRYRAPDGATRYEIHVENPDSRAERVRAVEIDGTSGMVDDGAAIVPLAKDGALHRVTVTLGA
jgi:cyclic beta-1,2-glucan synthetase